MLNAHIISDILYKPEYELNNNSDCILYLDNMELCNIKLSELRFMDDSFDKIVLNEDNDDCKVRKSLNISSASNIEYKCGCKFDSEYYITANIDEFEVLLELSFCACGYFTYGVVEVYKNAVIIYQDIVHISNVSTANKLLELLLKNVTNSLDEDEICKTLDYTCGNFSI